MKKKIFIFIGVICLLFIGLIGYYVVSDLNQESKLEDEIVLIDNLVNTDAIDKIDLEKLYSYLDRTITKGDYAKVERAFKNYLKDNFDNVLKIVDLLNDDRIVEVLTVDNYINDGKEFIETKKYLNTYATELKECKNNYLNYFTEEKAMSYLDTNNLDSYYIDLYKDKYIGDLETALEDKTVEESINALLDTTSIMQQIIDLLSNNPNSWYIDTEYINFTDNNLSNEYDRLISLL